MADKPSATNASALALPLRAIELSKPGSWEFGWCVVDATDRVLGYCMTEAQAKQLAAPFSSAASESAFGGGCAPALTEAELNPGRGVSAERLTPHEPSELVKRVRAVSYADAFEGQKLEMKLDQREKQLIETQGQLIERNAELFEARGLLGAANNALGHQASLLSAKDRELSARSSGAVALPYDEAYVDELTGRSYDNLSPELRREFYINAHRLARRFEHQAKSAAPAAALIPDAVRAALMSADLYQVLMDVQCGIDSPGLKSMANGAIRKVDKARAALSACSATRGKTE